MILERLTFFRWPVEIPIFWRFSADAAMPGHCRRTGSRSDAPLQPVVVFTGEDWWKSSEKLKFPGFWSADIWCLTSLKEVVKGGHAGSSKKTNPNHQLSEASFFHFRNHWVFFGCWFGVEPRQVIMEIRFCPHGCVTDVFATKEQNDYSTPQSSTMTVQNARNLVVFHSFYPEFELWLSFLPETRIKTLILRKLTWLAVNSSFSIGNTSWHGGFSSQWFIAICIFNVFSHQKEQKTFNLSTLLLGLAPGKFQYVAINKPQTKRYKNSGIFHSRKNHKAQEYPWIYSCFFAAFYIHGT